MAISTKHIEIGMAYASGKTIILIMEDAGTFPTNKIREKDFSPVYGNNPHEHPFVTVPVALRLNNLDEAIYAVNALLSEGI